MRAFIDATAEWIRIVPQISINIDIREFNLCAEFLECGILMVSKAII